MRQAPLLKLNGVEVGSPQPQGPLFDVFDKRLKLGMEHTNNQVRAICRHLAIKKCRGDLRPVRIGSHSNKKVTSSIESIDFQGILQVLLHVASAASKRRRKNELFAQLVPVSISIGSNSISQALEELYPKLVLVEFDKFETVLL